MRVVVSTIDPTDFLMSASPSRRTISFDVVFERGASWHKFPLLHSTTERPEVNKKGEELAIRANN